MVDKVTDQLIQKSIRENFGTQLPLSRHIHVSSLLLIALSHSVISQHALLAVMGPFTGNNVLFSI